MIDSVMGAGPELLEGPGTNSAGSLAYGLDAFQTPLLDLTKTYFGIELVPARPGYYAVLFVPEWVIESTSGTQVTPITYRAGSDLARINGFPAQSNPINADVNGVVPPSLGTAGTSAVPAHTQFFANTPVYFDLFVAAVGTGGFACTARLACLVRWYPFGGT